MTGPRVVHAPTGRRGRLARALSPALALVALDGERGAWRPLWSSTLRPEPAADAVDAHLASAVAALGEEAAWRRPAPAETPDMINRPPHYTSHPSGVECLDVVEHMGFCLGNVIKYVWRADLKGDAVEDLRKARVYLDREITRRERAGQAERGAA